MSRNIDYSMFLLPRALNSNDNKPAGDSGVVIEYLPSQQAPSIVAALSFLIILIVFDVKIKAFTAVLADIGGLPCRSGVLGRGRGAGGERGRVEPACVNLFKSLRWGQ